MLSRNRESLAILKASALPIGWCFKQVHVTNKPPVAAIGDGEFARPLQDDGKGGLSLRGVAVMTETAHNRKRAEYGFGEYGFKHRTQ